MLENTGYNRDCSASSAFPEELVPSRNKLPPIQVLAWAACVHHFVKEMSHVNRRVLQVPKQRTNYRRFSLVCSCGSLFFPLLILELICGGLWHPSHCLLAHLKYFFIRNLILYLLLVPADMVYQQREEALFTIFYI